MLVLRTAIGLAFFCLVAWGLSSHRRRVPWRVVLFGLAMQLALAAFILRTEVGAGVFRGLSNFFVRLISMASAGTELVFGSLASGEHGFIFAFAGTGLAAIIFFSALMSVLYHLGVMQVLIWAFARVMSTLLGVSGAESMAMAANVFVGQTEAPLVVKPYIADMTRSELNALMTGGFATIAGSVLAVYIGVLGPEYGPHLIAASVMSAPAAFLVAKIMLPETEQARTGRQVGLRIERTAHNLIEAAANGTSDGLKLWLNVIAMLIAFTGLVAFIDWPLEALGDALAAWGLEGGLSLSRLFGWLFAPVAWCMGVQGWGDCQVFGTLLGYKVTVNEFVAFSQMQSMLPLAGGVTESIAESGAVVRHFAEPRHAKMAAYALCGFANFASVGIQMGGIPPLAPNRKSDVAQLALRAMLGGAFASWMTATTAGLFLD